jgi:hypothetical protein
VLLTRSPLEYPRRGLSARLACVKHAASVRPEPGSNSPTKTCRKIHPSKKHTPQNKCMSNCQRNPHHHKKWRHEIKQKLALAYQKHPVEFSKNNHTPTPTHTRADTGATTQTYPTGSGPSRTCSHSEQLLVDPARGTRTPSRNAACSSRTGSPPRPADLREVRPAPCQISYFTGSRGRFQIRSG